MPLKDDTEVTPQDLQGRNLVLFGDPASNSLIAQALPGLPLRWTKDKVTLDGQEYDRTPGGIAGQPWRSGAPNGAVSIQDALVALNQVGTNCT